MTLRIFCWPTSTLALLPGSPAINTGSNAAAAGLTMDQRGFNRIVNLIVDIGAYEFQPSPTATADPAKCPAVTCRTQTFWAQSMPTAPQACSSSCGLSRS